MWGGGVAQHINLSLPLTGRPPRLTNDSPTPGPPFHGGRAFSGLILLRLSQQPSVVTVL